MPVEGIRLENATIAADNGVVCTDGKDLSFQDVQILAKHKPLFIFDHCSRVRGESIENLPDEAIRILPPNIPFLTVPYYTGITRRDVQQVEALLTWQMDNGG